MPEGPSIVIAKEAALSFEGQRVIDVEGNTKVDMERMRGKTVIALKTWGKHFLICFDSFTIRIHFLMFGTYRINERKETSKLRLGLTFPNGELNLYTCSVKILEGDVSSHYDFTADIMNDNWSPAKAKKKLKAGPDRMVCDVLLDQDIFAGVGNIIKNEVLYRIKVHPESLIARMPKKKIDEMVEESRIYTFQFLDWKKKFELRKQWLAYSKKKCVRCDLPMTKGPTGIGKRRSFFCMHCQKLYV